jgi:nitrate reductase NapE component
VTSPRDQRFGRYPPPKKKGWLRRHGFEIGMSIWAVICLALLGGAIFVVWHFVAKVW